MRIQGYISATTDIDLAKNFFKHKVFSDQSYESHQEFIPPNESTIQEMVEKFWYKYDIEKTDVLHKEESKKFAQDILEKLGSSDLLS